MNHCSIKLLRLVFIFTALFCFSLLGFASKQYQYSDRYLAQLPAARNFSKQKQLITFAVSPNSKEIYAINTNKKLTIADAATGAVLKTIPLPITDEDDYAYNIVFTPDGKKAYFSTLLKNIYVIDTSKREIIGKVANKPETEWVYSPTSLAMAPNGHYLYAIDSVGENNSPDKAPKIYVIDTQIDSVVATIKKDHLNESGFGWFDASFVFNKDASLVYFTDMRFGSISILNTRDNILEDEAIKYNGENIGSVAINPKNTKLYVLSWQGSIFITDLLTRQTIEQIPLGTDAFNLALVANGTKLYVVGAEAVSVFDISKKNKLIKKIPVSGKPHALSVSSDGSSIYLGNAGSNDISVIDIATDKVVRVITIDN